MNSEEAPLQKRKTKKNTEKCKDSLDSLLTWIERFFSFSVMLEYKQSLWKFLPKLMADIFEGIFKFF